MKKYIVNMRNYLREALASLSNFDYQVKCWVKRECLAENKCDNIQIVFSFLIDDTDFIENFQSEIGRTCIDEIEASIVADVAIALYSMIENYGENREAQFYMCLKEWQEIMLLAKIALKKMEENDKFE